MTQPLKIKAVVCGTWRDPPSGSRLIFSFLQLTGIEEGLRREVIMRNAVVIWIGWVLLGSVILAASFPKPLCRVEGPVEVTTRVVEGRM